MRVPMRPQIMTLNNGSLQQRLQLRVAHKIARDEENARLLLALTLFFSVSRMGAVLSPRSSPVNTSDSFDSGDVARIIALVVVADDLI